MLKEFKEFALRGNLVDIAVAFVMGAAFGKVITALTEGLVAPIISLLTGGIDFSKKEFRIRPDTQVKDTAGKIISGSPELTLKWGAFITAVIDFILVAFVMFLIIKGINRLRRKEAVAPAAPPAPTVSEKLLMEIRDELKKG